MLARDVVQAHYDSYLGEGRPSIIIPEWSNEGEAPFIVYWKPLTLREHGAAFPEGRIDVMGYVRLIATKAEDRGGKLLFGEQEDRHVLARQADHIVLRRIAEQMLSSPTVQDIAVALAADNFRLAMFWLADKLGKTIEEIEGMSVAAFKETLAYYGREKK